jgi:two-component system chemotaxis response regulator CheB
MCSAYAAEGCETTLKALEYGAVDVILKPRIGAVAFLEESRIRLIDTVKAAAGARVRARMDFEDIGPMPKLGAEAMIARPAPGPRVRRTDRVVVVGASTGGTEAIRCLLEALPENAPGMVIVQHMPERFTRSFADRLDGLCRMEVREARDGDPVVAGTALIAPGNRHTLLASRGSRLFVEVKDGPLVSRHRPSVNVLFRSAAEHAGANAVGILLTGMGDDGADGMVELKAAGAMTIAQDEETSVVFGMPREAIRRAGADRVLPLSEIPGAVCSEVAS